MAYLKRWTCGCVAYLKDNRRHIRPCETHNHGKGLRIHVARLRRLATTKPSKQPVRRVQILSITRRAQNFWRSKGNTAAVDALEALYERFRKVLPR